MVEVDPLILGGLIGSIVVLLATVLGITYRHGKNHGKIDNQISNLEKDLEKHREPLAYATALLQVSKYPGIIELVKSVGPEPPKRNPYDLNRKYELLKHYQDGSISLAEAKELQGILQEDLQHAQDTNSAAVVAIVILLAALVAIVAMFGSKD